MSPEAPRPPLKRDELLRGIDAKSEVLADLWRSANSLPPPLLSDSQALVDEQNQLLLSVVSRLAERMLDEYRVFQYYNGVRDNFHGALNLPAKERYERDMHIIEIEHPEMEFVKFIVDGVDKLTERRKRIRAFQILYGEPIKPGYYYDSLLYRFGSIQDLPQDLGPYITSVVVGKYSINVYLDADVYSKIKIFNDELESDGIHLGDSGIINVIKDRRYAHLRRKIKFNSTEEAARMGQVALHEEFHGLEDAFPNSNPAFKQVRYEVSRIADRIDGKTTGVTLASILAFQGYERPTEIDLTQIPDSSLEELLAEFAATVQEETTSHPQHLQLMRSKNRSS